MCLQLLSLCNNKKAGNFVISDNIDGSREHYAK